MKKLICFLMTILMLFMVSCGERTLHKEQITIFHATDMHYLSQQLTENSPEFVEMIRNGDGKMVHYIEPIIEAFVKDVKEQQPDFLLIGGDMTFNGERLSHIDFAQKLKTIEENGTQVLVIPGNHDVDYPFCYGYTETTYYKADRMTDREFEQVYQDYGLKQAYTRDQNSFSYMYRLTDKITLIALDSNRGGGTGIVHTGTISWLEKELEKADKDTTFICLTHQNLLTHFENESFINNYTIINNQPVINLFEKYNVRVNLSGHIHTQHIFSDNVITDIATESMAVLPCAYGVIKVGNDSIDYSTKRINVTGWAEINNITDRNLLDFDEYSKNFYIKSQKNLCMKMLEETAITTEDRQIMSEFFAQLNIYYFSGVIDEHYDSLLETEGFKKWLEKGEDLWHYQYILARMEEGRSGNSHDSCHIDI